MSFVIKNLVFEGTGVRNAIYAGGLLALEEAGLFSGVEAAAGTSSGAIVATMVSLGYTPSEVRDAILDLDFKKLLDGALLTGPLRMFTRYGWHKGDYFLSQIREIIKAKTGSAHTTFGEALARGCKQLRVVGVNITQRSVRVFPDEGSMDMPIADAVRISMSIPLFFASVRHKNDVYVDGGVMWNYPIGVFDKPGQLNAETMGFHVANTPVLPQTKTRTPHDYFAGLFGALIRQQESDLNHRPLDRMRTVTVPDGGISLTDFWITRAQKQALVEAGREATHKHLRSRVSAEDLSGHAAPAVVEQPASRSRNKSEVARGRSR